MSNVSRGSYYKRKTKLWFEKQGYHVEYLETMYSIFTPRGIIYKKKDCLGSDGVSMNGKEIIFWNSKTTEQGDYAVEKMIAEATREFEKFPFPEHVKRQVIVWLPRVKKPIVTNCI